MFNKKIQLNFNNEKKIINLPDKYNDLIIIISSLFSINEDKKSYINIYYKDNQNNINNIKHSEDYKKFLEHIDKNFSSSIEVNVKLKNKLNSEILNGNYNNFFLNNRESFIFNPIEENINNTNEIIYPVMCSICKNYKLKNVIYYCLRCKNYVCSKCFEKNKQFHSHSYNIILNNEQFQDIKKISIIFNAS
jgi:hypothetical protein